MKKALQLPFSFDPAPLLKEIQSFGPEMYIKSPSVYTTDGKIWAMELMEGVGSFSEHTGAGFPPNAILQNAPELLALREQIKSPVVFYRIHIVNPGGAIQTHRDAGRHYAQGMVRIHVPIVTDPEFYFYFEEGPERVVMQPGECWYLNVHQRHFLEHKGTEDRIHLVLDCLVNEWWDDILLPHFPEKKEFSDEEQAEIDAALRELGYTEES